MTSFHGSLLPVLTVCEGSKSFRLHSLPTKKQILPPPPPKKKHTCSYWPWPTSPPPQQKTSPHIFVNFQNTSSWFFVSGISGFFCMYNDVWHPSNWTSSPSQWMEWLESEESSSSSLWLRTSVGSPWWRFLSVSGPRSTRPMACRHGMDTTPLAAVNFLGRCLIPFGCKKVVAKSGENLEPPPLIQNLSTTSSHPRKFKSSGETRIRNPPPLLPNVAVPLLPGAPPLHRHPPQIFRKTSNHQAETDFSNSLGRWKIVFMLFFVDWSLEVCKFYLYFFLDDFKGIFWSNDHFMEFFECLDICMFFF